MEIEPLRGALDVTVRPPGSKSITNRALLVAALAGGTSQLAGALRSDDTVAMRRCLEALGVDISDDEDPWLVEGVDGRRWPALVTLNAAASGTTARFVTAAATLADGPSTIDGTPRMRERPIGDLVAALRAMGADIETPLHEGYPPVRIEGGGIEGGEVTIDARRSSQFASAVLMVAPCAPRGLTLGFIDDVIVSKPYLGTTLEVMTAFGASAQFAGDSRVRVEPGGYQGTDLAVEADASAAAYAFAAAVAAAGVVRVEGIPRVRPRPIWVCSACSPKWGARSAVPRTSLRCGGPERGELRGVDVDMTGDAGRGAGARCRGRLRQPAEHDQGCRHPPDQGDRPAGGAGSRVEADRRRASAGPDLLTVEPAPLPAACQHLRRPPDGDGVHHRRPGRSRWSSTTRGV